MRHAFVSVVLFALLPLALVSFRVLHNFLCESFDLPLAACGACGYAVDAGGAAAGVRSIPHGNHGDNLTRSPQA